MECRASEESRLACGMPYGVCNFCNVRVTEELKVLGVHKVTLDIQ